MAGKNNGVADNGPTNSTTGGQPTDEGRASDGRFTLGNRGGPGNPYARQTAMIRKAAAECATPEAMRGLMGAMLARGMAGDTAAARLWMQYAGGRPGPSADPDALDAHELALRRQGVATPEDMKALFERLPAWMMCELAQVVAGHVQAHMGRTLAEGMLRQTANEEEGAKLEPEKAGPYMASKADWAPDWLREGRGVPDGLAEVLEACPAYMPDVGGRDRAGHSYAEMLRRMRDALVGPLPGGIKEGNDCHLVTQPDDKRGNRPPGKKGKDGKNGAAHPKNGAAGGKGCR